MSDDYEELTGEALRDFIDAPPVARCSACGRKTWEAGSIGHACLMPQPSGDRCPGTFEESSPVPEPDTKHKDWPEIEMVRRAPGFRLYPRANRLPDDELETYVPISSVRARLFAEAVQLERDGGINVDSIRKLKAQGIRDALAAAFPGVEPNTDDPAVSRRSNPLKLEEHSMNRREREEAAGIPVSIYEEAARLREALKEIADVRSDATMPGIAEAFERRGEIARGVLAQIRGEDNS